MCRPCKHTDQLGWSESVTDWKELVNREDIDLIDINAPSDAHKEIAIAAAKAGKHIFCEKPLALTLADAREIRRRRKKRELPIWLGLIIDFRQL